LSIFFPLLVLLIYYAAVRTPYILNDPARHLKEDAIYTDSYILFYYNLSEFTRL